MKIVHMPVFDEKFRHFTRLITVEPLLACYIFANGLCRPLVENLELDKSCRVNLGYNDTVCDAILSGNHTHWTEANRLVQVEISNMRSWQHPLQAVTPLVLVLFLGSFSDRFKCRKPFMVLPAIGEIVSLVGCLLSVIYMREWRLEVLGFARHIVNSFFGGTTMMVMASTSYIADHTTVDARTTRIGALQIVMSVFSLIVQPLSGILLLNIGYYYVILIAMVIQIFSVIYGMFLIEEERPKEMFNRGWLKNCFNPKHAIITFKVLSFKKKQHHIHLIYVIFVMVLVKTALQGEISVLFLYTQAVFHWTPVEFGYFLGTTSLVGLIGITLSITLFSKLMKLNDLTIILIALLDRIATNAIHGLAKTPLVFYLGIIVSVLNGGMKSVIRSFTTKIVTKDNLGKAVSLFGVFEAIVPMYAVPLYNRLIYVNTINDFPSAFYFFSIVLYAVSILIVLFVIVIDRRYQQNHKS